ncbi:hypothetical protein C0991_003083 [Blastosporella zonata]|nr:hypothetical protein C0991_003083 [Blastosporella zonata]
MRWSLPARLCAALLLIAPHSWALHESDVGVLDWHKFLVGVPLVAAPVTAPSFHALDSVAYADSNLTENPEIIYTATANNVFAALNPKDGSVVWRHIYQKDDRIMGYYRHSNLVATLSGTGGATLRLFDGITGFLHLEERLHAPESGRPAEPHYLGTHITFYGDDAAYVLTNGHIVRRIDTTTGAVQWTWASPSALTIHTNLVSTSTAVFVIAFARSTTSLTLHITVLDPQTGALLNSREVPSSIQHLHTYTVLSNSNTELPHVVWIEDGSLKAFRLNPELNGSPTPIVFKRNTQSTAAYERILDVGLALSGNAVVVASDGSATLLVLMDGSVQGVGALAPPVNPNPNQEGQEETTEATWAGGLGDVTGEVVVGRVYWSHKFNTIKTDTLTFTPAKATLPNLRSASFEIAFDTKSHGVIAHTALSRSTSRSPGSLLLTTSTGAVQLWELTSSPSEKWTREEALAAVVLSEFVQLPEGRSEGAGGSRGDGEGYLARLWRHAGDAKNFPQYLSGFIRRFLTGSYASTTSIPASTEEIPVRDAFGFRQIIVAATMQGKIFGLDSSTGHVVWSRVLGLGWAAEVGATVVPIKMFVLGGEETTVEQATEGPEVVLVAQRRADNTLVDTVIFHINPLTGASASGPVVSDIDIPQEDSNGLLQGFDIIPGPVVEAYLLSPPAGSSQEYATSVLLLDEFLQVYLYPSTPQTRAILRELQPSLHFPLRTNAEGSTRVLGHSIGPHHAGELGAEGHDGERGFVAYATWTLGLPSDEVVKRMVPQTHGPVASLGKVLGNRTTLYKYLNPKLFVVLTSPAPATATAKKGKTCGLYVVDAVKGSVAYRVSLPALSAKDGGEEPCDVKAMLVENWLVYHYYDPDWAGAGLSKGWKIVSVELYEGSGLDDKTSSGALIHSSDMTSFANDSVNIVAYEQAYIVPHAITAFSPTSTKFGMTVKDLIVASRSHQIASIQRNLLNPRRPHRKVTAEEQEEFLVPYEPILLSDPRRVLSHNYEVANIAQIITSPTLLESTSLVFAYGLDMFLTRVAPSNTFDVLNENFNKAQLVLTVTGLAMAIIITKPMVQRKRLREKWYQ